LLICGGGGGGGGPGGAFELPPPQPDSPRAVDATSVMSLLFVMSLYRDLAVPVSVKSNVSFSYQRAWILRVDRENVRLPVYVK
jgi:hypothetical protein